MTALLSIRSGVIEVHRYINASVYWRRPPGPPERYELWIRQDDGRERKFTIQTQIMPARCGHAVNVIAKANGDSPQVLGLFNASTMDAVNYMRTDPPPLLTVWEFVALPAIFLVMAAWWGDAGMVLFVPIAVTYILIASFSRTIYRALWRLRVERALAHEAARNGWRSPR